MNSLENFIIESNKEISEKILGINYLEKLKFSLIEKYGSNNGWITLHWSNLKLSMTKKNVDWWLDIVRRTYLSKILLENITLSSPLWWINSL